MDQTFIGLVKLFFRCKNILHYSLFTVPFALFLQGFPLMEQLRRAMLRPQSREGSLDRVCWIRLKGKKIPHLGVMKDGTREKVEGMVLSPS